MPTYAAYVPPRFRVWPAHRTPARSILAASVAALALLPCATAAQDAHPAQLQAVRSALGIEDPARLSALQLKGHARRQVGDREFSGDLEIAIQFPDRFLRVDEMGMGDPGNRMRRFHGVNGTEVVEGGSGGGMMMMRIGPPGAEMNPERMKELQLRRAHREFARLAVLLAAGSSSPHFPLEYTYAGEAVSDDGKTFVFDVKGPDGFDVKLFTDQVTNLPLMISSREPAPRQMVMRGGRGERPTREEMERRVKEMEAQGPPQLADVQWFVSEHKEVDGVMVPTKVRRTVNGEVEEEWDITEIAVNPQFKADKFGKS